LLRELGLRIPQDIAVLGFDDIEAADYMELSTISQAPDESGRLAAELLKGRIQEPGRPLQSVQLKVSVIERSTNGTKIVIKSLGGVSCGIGQQLKAELGVNSVVSMAASVELLFKYADKGVLTTGNGAGDHRPHPDLREQEEGA